MELLACRCVRFCRLHDCVCMANGLTFVQTCVDNQFVKEARLKIIDAEDSEHDDVVNDY